MSAPNSPNSTTLNQSNDNYNDNDNLKLINEPNVNPPSFEPFINALLEPASNILTELHSRIGNPPEFTPKDLSETRLQIQALTQNLVDQAREAAKDVVNKRQKDANNLSIECNQLISDVDDLRLALGEDGKRQTKFNPSTDSSETLLTRRDRLKVEFEDYNNNYNNRLIKLDNLLDRLKRLYDVLGPKLVTLPPETDDKFKDVTSFTMRTMEHNIQRAENELSRRKDYLKTSLLGLSNALIEIVEPWPAPSEIDDESIKSFDRIFLPQISTLLETEDEQIILSIVDSLNPTDSLIEYTEILREDLENEKTRREEEIQTMYDCLNPLWDKLDVSEEEREEFINQHMGSTLEVIDAYHKELERMQELKRQNMELFVQRIRTDIEKLWDYMKVGQNERSQFQFYNDDSYSEECLAEHENLLNVLQEESKTKNNVLKKFHLYNQVITEEKQLQESASDASRLLGRGPRDPGRLIREEKMRKRVAKKPQIEKDLLDMITNWENENARMFLINDERFLDNLQQKIDNEIQEKENKRNIKKGLPPTQVNKTQTITRKTSNSSINSNGKRKPVNATNETTTPAPSAKRMRVGSTESQKGLVNSITKSTHSTSSTIKPKRVISGKQAPPRYPLTLSSVAESPANFNDPFSNGNVKPAQAQVKPVRHHTAPATYNKKKSSRRSSFKPSTRVASVSSVIDHGYAELEAEALAAGDDDDDW